MNRDCLIKLQGVVSDEVHAILKEAADNGDQKAWDFAMEESHADIQMLRANTIRNANKRSNFVDYIKGQVEKGYKVETAVQDIFSGAGRHQGAGIVSLDSRIEALRWELNAKNAELFDKTKPIQMGLNRAGNPEFVNNLVKAIFKDQGAAVSKDIQAMVDAWHQTTKYVRDRLNGAGRNLEELQNFGIPVNHYPPKMVKAGEDEWVEHAKKFFVTRRKKGWKPISDDDLLRKIYKSITTEGADDFGEELGKRSGKAGSPHQHFRWLQPRSGEAWLEYTKLYGAHNHPVDAMKEYLDMSATDLGILEVLGTKPHEMTEALVKEAKRVTGNPRAGGLAMPTLDHIKSRQPAAHDSITNTFRGLRLAQTITKLPLSGITAVSDTAFVTTRSLFLGMKPSKVLSRQIKNLATRSDYKTAAKLGLIGDYANHMAVMANRHAESVGFSMLDRITDFSMRANGLNHWTNSSKATFGLEFLSFMAESSAKSMSDIAPGLRRAFERYGITGEMWGQFQKATTKIEGVDFIDPMSDVLSTEARTRLLGMIKEETVFAVPEPNAMVRAIAAGTAPQHSVLSEIIKTGTQFKTFGISTFTNTMGMMLDKGLPTPVKAQYMANLALTTTLLGVGVLQLKDIAKGKTPREFDMKLVAQGFEQGGFLGIAQDVAMTNPDLFGGYAAKIAGPTVSDITRMASVLHGTFTTEDGIKKKLIPAAGTALEEAMFFTKIPPFRVAFDRLLWDHRNRLMDPEYYGKQRRAEKFMREERGQTYWSPPK